MAAEVAVFSVCTCEDDCTFLSRVDEDTDLCKERRGEGDHAGRTLFPVTVLVILCK